MKTFLTRRGARRILGPLLTVLLAGGLVTGCSSGSSSAGSSPAGASAGSAAAPVEWTWTDATGTTVTLPQRPERVAGYADYAIGMFAYGLQPAAVFGRVDVATDPRFAGYDLSSTAIVGTSYGQIDLEALAAAEPDLIVTGIYPTDRAGTLDTTAPYYAFADLEQQAQLAKIAPIVAIKVGGDGRAVIESLTGLATALGADPDRVAAAKADFDAAAADLTAAAGQADLEVTQMYADPDGIYVVKPADEPETQLYRSLGVTYTDLHPDGPYYWDIFSWENVGQMMTGDILLPNVEGFQAEELMAQPTFAASPALVAGQVNTWNGAALDYASQAVQMGKLAEILRSSRNVTGT
ncbi:ABC transporter substrate-binding protein [Nakamurella sp.]|uniref:ABC transporter substrate-binding protein n=1 Tax=Nakamurella sp. TaxID=1869182 RepID=UPI003B3B4257